MTRARDLANVADDVSTGTVVTTASPSLGRRNLIINGAMQVAQRGTSATAGDGYNSVDRFETLARNGTDLTQEQISLSTSDNAYDYGFRTALRYTCVSAYSGGNGYSAIRYNFEGQDTNNSGWNHLDSNSNITVSFWARSSLAGTYYALLRSTSGTVQQYTKGFTLVANTWTKVTFTATGDSSITINNDNNAGLQLFIATYYGPDYTDAGHTTDVWATYSGTSQAPVYAQNWRNTAGATFDLTGVQLEVGSVATPFEHRSYGEELAACQRYYQLVTNGNMMVAGTTSIYLNPQFFCEMRSTPSISQTGVFSINNRTANRIQSSTGHTFYAGDTRGVFIDLLNFSSLLTDSGVSARYLNTNAVVLDAEI